MSLLTQLGLWLTFIAVSMCFLSVCHMEVPPALLLLVRLCLDLGDTTGTEELWQLLAPEDLAPRLLPLTAGFPMLTP